MGDPSETREVEQMALARVLIAQKRVAEALTLLRRLHQTASLHPLVKPLTRRELEVLRLLVGGCADKEIAQRLFISVATVKRHVANIYGKLNVNNRTRAVALARELNLL